MPNLPFWCQQAHRTKILSSYRALQRLALQFKDTLHRRYLYYEIRERFRYYRHNTSPRQTSELLLEAEKIHARLGEALSGNKEALQWLDDLAQARTGRLYDVLVSIRHSKKPAACHFVKDIRSKKARQHDPHKRYRFPWPLDLYEKAGISMIDEKCSNDANIVKPKRVARNTRCIITSTSLGYLFRRHKPFVQPHWLSMMMKRRARQSLFKLERGRRLEEWRSWLVIEEKMMRQLGINDAGWTKLINEELSQSMKRRQQLEEALARQESLD